MIAYNTTWLDNLLVQQETDKALRHQTIGPEEAQAIKTRYPVGFYTPNLFIRIAFFLLTVVIVSFTLGILSLLFIGGGGLVEWGIVVLLLGLFVYIALEFFIKSKHHYRSGIDDALLWLSAGFLLIGVNAIHGLSYTANAILLLIVTLYLSLRFANAVMSLAATIFLLAVIFLLYIKLGAVAKATTPFLMLLVCGGLYAGLQQAARRTEWKHYSFCCTLCTIVVLVCFYLAGNYYAVREASNAMFDLHLREGQGIPAGWFFWIWTLTIPVVYIFRGIQKKDPLLLRVGLLLIAALVFTIRTYYHLLPIETAMVAGGLVLLVTAYSLMRYLKTPRHGFTAKQADDPHFMDKLQVESLIIAETFHPAPPATPTPESGFSFGGGSGSGGGASGGF